MHDQLKDYSQEGFIGKHLLRPDYKEALRASADFMKTIPTEAFDKLLDDRCEKVKQDCLSLEQLFPRLSLIVPKGIGTATPTLDTFQIPVMLDEWQKDPGAFMVAAGYAAAIAKAAVVGLFLESGMYYLNDRDAAIEYVNKKNAGDNPTVQGQKGSVEGIVVVGHTLDGRMNCACYPVRRSKEKKIVLNKPVSVAYSSPDRPVDPINKFLFVHQDILELFFKSYFSCIAEAPELGDLREEIKKQAEKDEQNSQFKKFD